MNKYTIASAICLLRMYALLTYGLIIAVVAVIENEGITDNEKLIALASAILFCLGVSSSVSIFVYKKDNANAKKSTKQDT